MESNDYPLLHDSKGIIVMCMIISSLTSMQLVHIEHAFIGSCITNEVLKFIVYHYYLND
jgi:hypothetical protein